ncbi:MAG TPA: anhydro-N-acetylmuramic acid kinase [Hyphomicrobiales bacterium]|nr:anhydro-N-acetylmuramic acid kinase [Hyphomicrobiales bacterium]
MRAIGTMSGTSLDGVDVALVETDGETVEALGPTGYRPYADGERALLRQALADAAGLSDRTARPGTLAAAERLVTDAHAEAVEGFVAEHGLDRRAVDVVGFHGQTVLHRPERRLTVQIGDGAALARRLGIAVVHDLRAADVAAGGQGAPLVPAYHRALAAKADLTAPVAVLNLGGVGNLTFIGAGGELVAFDTGPANAPIDDLVGARTGAPFDRDGALARAGRADQAVLARLLARPYFAALPPKSLDRVDFADATAAVSALSTEDAAATLAAFVAASVARGAEHLPTPPARWVVAGGGSRNPAIMAELHARLGVPVEPADALGFAADAIEAQAFAFLAVRSLKGLPLTFPGTTGVAAPLPGGVVSLP